VELYPPLSHPKEIAGVRLKLTNLFLAFLVPGLLLAQTAPISVAPDSNAGQTTEAPDSAVTTPSGSNDAAKQASPADKRIFGVLPNYRTADGSIPFERITAKQKFTIARKDSLDYPSYVLAGVFATIAQANNTNPSFGQGVEGFAKRYGTSVSDQIIGNFMTEAIWPSLLHQDPRYFRKINGSFKSRLGYALTRTLVTRTDRGNWAFNSAEFLGNGTVAAIGNLYYPDGRDFGDTMQRMFTQIGTDTISNVLKEFWPDMKRKWFHKRTTGSSAD
jgi:hypothetical protein